MMHDNWNPEDNSVFGHEDSVKIKREIPRVDGLYFVYLKKEIKQADGSSTGLLYLNNGEWLSYPSKYTLNTLHINENFLGGIGPLPESL